MGTHTDTHTRDAQDSPLARHPSEIIKEKQKTNINIGNSVNTGFLSTVRLNTRVHADCTVFYRRGRMHERLSSRNTNRRKSKRLFFLSQPQNETAGVTVFFLPVFRRLETRPLAKTRRHGVGHVVGGERVSETSRTSWLRASDRVERKVCLEERERAALDRVCLPRPGLAHTQSCLRRASPPPEGSRAGTFTFAWH